MPEYEESTIYHKSVTIFIKNINRDKHIGDGALRHLYPTLTLVFEHVLGCIVAIYLLSKSYSRTSFYIYSNADKIKILFFI